jgi:predicted RNase H-like HicB family nuclease
VKYHFKVHREEKSYWAEGVEIPWANTQAGTLEELKKNMQEVLELCLGEPEDSDALLPLPKRGAAGRNVVAVPVSPQVALAAMLRRERLSAKMSQRSTAEKLGIRHLSQYQRLESGKTANPELGTLAKLKRLFPGISVDAALV